MPSLAGPHLLTSVVPSFLYVFPTVLTVEEELYLHMLAWLRRTKLSLRLVLQNSEALLCVSDLTATVQQLPSVKWDISVWVDKIPVDVQIVKSHSNS